MRDIVDTIDRFGLRCRYLRKHQEQATTWLSGFRGSPMKSKIAEKYRKRIAKYGERLFTFLDHDGIPWNNNNAENSIKPFAKYKKTDSGTDNRAWATRLFGAAQYRSHVQIPWHLVACVSFVRR